MATLAEKIEASKVCCRRVKDYLVEKKQATFDQLFGGDWEAFVIKQDEKTGKFIGKTACYAHRPV